MLGLVVLLLLIGRIFHTFAFIQFFMCSLPIAWFPYPFPPQSVLGSCCSRPVKAFSLASYLYFSKSFIPVSFVTMSISYLFLLLTLFIYCSILAGQAVLDYEGDIARIIDLVRATILCASMEAMLAVVQELLRHNIGQELGLTV